MLLFLSMRLSFTCSHQDHSPPWGLCPTCPYCWHFFFFFAILSVSVAKSVYMWPGIPVCIHVSLAEMAIPSARKRPAARIWAWESVRGSVDMWRGAKLGTEPLSISMVQHCPCTAKALPESCWVLRENAYRQKNKFERLQTKTRDCQTLSQDVTNQKE